jgi:hypothetical protein
VWDAATGKPLLPPLTGHEDAVVSAQFSPDGARIVSASGDKTIRVWDAATGKPLLPPLTGHEDAVANAQFSPDGARIVSTSLDKTIRVWDAATGKPLLPPLMGHTSWVSSAQFSADGARIVSASWDKTIRVWAVPAFARMQRLALIADSCQFLARHDLLTFRDREIGPNPILIGLERNPCNRKGLWSRDWWFGERDVIGLVR